MIIVAQSGASRQEHQQKEINTMTKTMNYVANKKQLSVQSSKNTLFKFQTDKFMRESLHMIHTQNNESANNTIKYIAPTNKTMSHITSLNNRISCVVGISIFRFNKY